MTRTILIGVVLVCVLGGCGNDAGKPQKGADASLRVKHVVDGSQGMYVEGSVWHLRVVDASGDPVLDRKLTDDSVTVGLGEGRYTLESEELPCDGNCGHLDPAADRCSTEVAVESRQQLAATVTLEPAHGCTIAVLESART
jgi:hypothetical protein